MLTIGNYGSMKIDDTESLRNFLGVYFLLWYYQFNYKNYKKNIYPKLLNNTFQSYQIEDLTKLNNQYFNLQNTRYVDIKVWELKTIESQIININNYLEERNIFDINLNFNYKSQKKTFKEVLIRLQNFESKMQGEMYLLELIRNADESWLLYFLGILLKDYNRIKEFLIKSTSTIIQPTITQSSVNQKLIDENLHSDVFKNKGFILFDYILNNYVSNNRGRKSDLNFYFRKLYKEGYIIESCRAENFKQWYEINFDDEFGQIKTLDEVRTEKRNRDYATSLEWFKQQK